MLYWRRHFQNRVVQIAQKLSRNMLNFPNRYVQCPSAGLPVRRSRVDGAHHASVEEHLSRRRRCRCRFVVIVVVMNHMLMPVGPPVPTTRRPFSAAVGLHEVGKFARHGVIWEHWRHQQQDHRDFTARRAPPPTTASLGRHVYSVEQNTVMLCSVACPGIILLHFFIPTF